MQGQQCQDFERTLVRGNRGSRWSFRQLNSRTTDGRDVQAPFLLLMTVITGLRSVMSSTSTLPPSKGLSLTATSSDAREVKGPELNAGSSSTANPVTRAPIRGQIVRRMSCSRTLRLSAPSMSGLLLVLILGEVNQEGKSHDDSDHQGHGNK